MSAIINEYYESANQIYDDIAAKITNFNSTYKREFAFATVMAINGAFVCVLLAVAFTIITSIARILWFFATLFWNSLTPGQKGLELSLVLSSFAAFSVIAIAARDMEKMIDTSFTKLKKEIADKTALIAEQEEKIAKLEAIINHKNDNSEEDEGNQNE